MNHESSEKLKSFTQLNAWKSGHKLVLAIYGLSKKLPKEEQFALSDQIRRAVVSITCNIAEGFGRYSYKDKQHYYVMALGSITEVQNLLLIVRDIGYLKDDEFNEIAKLAVEVHKLISGLVKANKGKVHDS